MKMYIYAEGNTKLIFPKAKWIQWFDEKGNHDSDGWSDGNTWFSDMLRAGILREV